MLVCVGGYQCSLCFRSLSPLPCGSAPHAPPCLGWPRAVKVLETPPGGYLEERLERQWVGSGTDGINQQQAPALLTLGASVNGVQPNGSGPDVDPPRRYR